MRLISKTRDYYDCIQAMGYDDYPVYVREMQKVPTPDYWKKDRNFTEHVGHIQVVTEHRLPTTDGLCTPGQVAFCGRFYPFYEFRGKHYYNFDKLKAAVAAATVDRDYFDWDKAKRLLAVMNDEKVRSGWRGSRWWGTPSLSRKSWNWAMENRSWTVPLETHRYFRAPIIATSPEKGIAVVVNPVLRMYKFEQVKDPYTAWQEISMFMGNELATQMDPNPEITDEMRAESKGFDKWSFRRHSTESKKPRKKRKQ